MFLCDRRMLAGLTMKLCESRNNISKEVNLLDVIVHYASLVEKLDAREQKAEPFTRL